MVCFCLSLNRNIGLRICESGKKENILNVKVFLYPTVALIQSNVKFLRFKIKKKKLNAQNAAEKAPPHADYLNYVYPQQRLLMFLTASIVSFGRVYLGVQLVLKISVYLDL